MFAVPSVSYYTVVYIALTCVILYICICYIWNIFIYFILLNINAYLVETRKQPCCWGILLHNVAISYFCASSLSHASQKALFHLVFFPNNLAMPKRDNNKILFFTYDDGEFFSD